ncbi:hypothetical protein SprV_0301159300 [Sparganum proliferum]
MVNPFTLAAWNVRVSLDDPRSSKPVQRTALATRELAGYEVDIAALSKTRFPVQGQLEEVGADHTFFWNGRKKAETPPPADQHILPPADAEEDDLDALPIAAVAAVELHSRSEAKLTERVGDQGDL